MSETVTVRKYGGSYLITIPAAIARLLDLKDGTIMNMDISPPKSLVLTPMPKKEELQ